MTLTRASAGDVKKLHRLEQELFSEENYPLSLRSFYYHVRNNLLYVAKSDDGAVIGYALTLIRRREAKLYSLGVAKAYRGGNIAYALMQKMSEELVSLGFKRTVLEVRTDNERAIALYKKIGFKVKKIIKGFYRDGCDAYLMERDYAD